MRSLAEKRHNDWTKAIRKRNICINEYGWEYYDNLHQYSKNKIHCSCPMCSAKTKNKGTHKIRQVYAPVRNYTKSDLLKIEKLNAQLKEYLRGELDEAI